MSIQTKKIIKDLSFISFKFYICYDFVKYNFSLIYLYKYRFQWHIDYIS
jgi:hypothetical protein